LSGRRSADDTLAAELFRLEVALAGRDPTGIVGGFEGVLDDGFLEFGVSGRVWDREATLTALVDPPAGGVTVGDFTLTVLADGVALATYRSISDVPGGGVTEGLRSSIWIRREGGWRLRFHQGTRTGTDPAA